MKGEPCTVVAGHICLDIIPDLSGVSPAGFMETFQPGRLLEVGAAVLTTGGAVSNTGLALHRLGLPVRLVGKVGPDAFGRAILEIVESHGAGLSQEMIVDPLGTTSYSVILSPPGYDRLFLHNSGANHTFSAEDVGPELVRQAGLFHFGYPPAMRRMFQDGGRELIALFQKVKASGATTSLDMSYPDPASEGGRADWRTILRGLLPAVDIFLPSIEEILYMLRRDLHDEFKQRGRIVDQVTPGLLHELSDELFAFGLHIVGIKMGERGLYLRTASLEALEKLGRVRPARLECWAGQEVWVPCCRVKVVGTTGAGDTTIAGFLAALLRGLSLEAALKTAVGVGACNVEAADAFSGLLSWEDTQARILAGWERLPLTIADPAWRWDAQNELWRTS